MELLTWHACSRPLRREKILVWTLQDHGNGISGGTIRHLQLRTPSSRMPQKLGLADRTNLWLWMKQTTQRRRRRDPLLRKIQSHFFKGRREYLRGRYHHHAG